jgi:hypothetical protein
VAPAARITATYDHDVEGAAEALLALLRPLPADNPAREPSPDDEATAEDEESAA